jgi:hypothetical protein
MKTEMKMILSATLIVFTLSVHSQEIAMATMPNSGETSKTSAPAPAANTELLITLKNTAVTNIYVFAGPKEDIRNPKVETYGGLSKNTLYLQVNDVVCLMTEDLKPKACTSIKPGTTNIEVNPSGTTIK